MIDLLISDRILEKHAKADIFAEQKKLHKEILPGNIYHGT